MDKKLRYIPELDGLRGIAILLVLLWHFFISIVDRTQVFSDLQIVNEFFKYSIPALKWTWSGVDLFFVLSGFLIGRILIENKGSQNYFKTFYIRRSFRILPIYILSIVAFWIFYNSEFASNFSWLVENPKPIFSYLLFIQNFFMGETGFGANWLSITWSLAVEEQFYLLLPLIVFYCRPKTLLGISVIGIVLAVIFRLTLPGLYTYVLLFSRMDALLMGVLIAIFSRNEFFMKYLNKVSSYLVALNVLMLILIVLLTLKANGGKIGGVLNHSVFAVFYSITLLLCISEGNNLIKNICRSSFLIHIGKISYGIYLYHYFILGILFQIFIGSSPFITDLLSFSISLASLIATYILAITSFHWFEKPLIKIGRRWNY